MAKKTTARATTPRAATATTRRTTKARTTKTTARGDQAPEAKRTASAQRNAADKLFKDADEAALRGLPADMTVEQHENHIRRQALGY